MTPQSGTCSTTQQQYEQLNGSISHPDGSYIGAAFDGIWIKVNIYMPDGKGGKRRA